MEPQEEEAAMTSPVQRECAALGPHESEPVRWRKVLYVKQPFDDNYVPQSFLQELVTNAGVARPSIATMMLGTAGVAQQISIVAIFFVVFMYASEGGLPVPVLFAADLGLFLSGYAIWSATDPKTPALLLTLRWFLLFGATLRVLSPVLRTLIVSYSDDTIYALTIVLSLANVILHDYSYYIHDDYVYTFDAGAESVVRQQSSSPSPTPHFRGTVSLNAAMFCAVLLASRLESNEMVFCFMLFAMEVFAFFPMARHLMRRRSLPLYLTITALLTCTAGGVLLTRDWTLFVVYSLIILLITVACPLWLRMIREWKFNIQGPWDIAKVQHTD